MHRFLQICRAALLACAAATTGFLLQSENGWSEPNYPRGQLIASGGGPGGRGSACFTCHGIDGSGQATSGFPRIAGLDARYLAKQLTDYALGTRPNDIMSPIARQLNREDRQAVSLYYAALSPGPAAAHRESSDPALIQEGAALYALGSANRHLQACTNCHGPGGRGLGLTYPALAGQHATYTVQQLWLWRKGQRRNSVGSVMEYIAKKMSTREIEAVAAYLATLRPNAQ